MPNSDSASVHDANSRSNDEAPDEVDEAEDGEMRKLHKEQILAKRLKIKKQLGVMLSDHFQFTGVTDFNNILLCR